MEYSGQGGMRVFAAIPGPLPLGWMNRVAGSPRLVILLLISLFALGTALLFFVGEKQDGYMGRWKDSDP